MPTRMPSPLACFTCVPALGPAQPTKTILKILKTPERLERPWIYRLNGGPLHLAGRQGLLLIIPKTPLGGPYGAGPAGWRPCFTRHEQVAG
jgi:hypothetical protein